VGGIENTVGSGSEMPGQAMQTMPRAWSSSVHALPITGPPSTAKAPRSSAARMASDRAAVLSRIDPDASMKSRLTLRP
jgi:hypothetical protein